MNATLIDNICEKLVVIIPYTLPISAIDVAGVQYTLEDVQAALQAALISVIPVAVILFVIAEVKVASDRMCDDYPEMMIGTIESGVCL